MSKRAVLVLLLAVSTAAWAQSPRSVVGGEAGLWAGGEMSAFNPDYSCSSNVPFECKQLIGPTVFFDLNYRSHWGAEGEARWLHWHSYGGQTESNYLIGPRYRVYQAGRFNAWLKVLLGGGWITTPYYPQAGSLKGSYFVYTPGGTLSYDITPRIAIRADYEYQFWPSFAGPPTFNSGAVIDHANGLTPNGVSIGIAYRFLPR